MPLDLYDRFREPLRGHTMQAVGDTEGPQLTDNFDVGKAIYTYQQLITELPPLNRQLLLYILDLLAVFASKSDENRMTSANLAAIFQPGMLSHPQHDMAPIEYRLSQDVLIFLIENQDHFLIGMKGTAADEETVNEVQNGGTPPPGTPNTSGRANTNVARSISNASAGADSIRKFGGVRRNVSTSSRHSRQSNGAPSPASPAYAVSMTPTSGVHRSNTVPSKRSPALPSGRLQKTSGSPSPTAALFTTQQTSTRGMSPSAQPSKNRDISPSQLPGLAPASALGASSLTPSSPVDSAAPTSQERLLGEPDIATPAKERTVSNLFARSPMVEGEKKQPNKLRKKRIPGSSNPSAQSSTQSFEGQGHPPLPISPGVQPTVVEQAVTEHPQLESIPSVPATQATDEATPPLSETPRATSSGHQETPQSPDRTLKPVASPPTSLRSHSSFNDQSDADHHEDSAAAVEQREKRSRWRLSRHRGDSQSLGNTLAPRRGLGSEAGASTSSIGSSAHPRKSFTGDTIPASSDSTLVGAHPHSSRETEPVEEKKTFLGRIKDKMREKRDEKERNKSPPPISDRVASDLPTRAKSIDVKREETLEPVVEQASEKPFENPSEKHSEQLSQQPSEQPAAQETVKEVVAPEPSLEPLLEPHAR